MERGHRDRLPGDFPHKHHSERKGRYRKPHPPRNPPHSALADKIAEEVAAESPWSPPGPPPGPPSPPRPGKPFDTGAGATKAEVLKAAILPSFELTADDEALIDQWMDNPEELKRWLLRERLKVVLITNKLARNPPLTRQGVSIAAVAGQRFLASSDIILAALGERPEDEPPDGSGGPDERGPVAEPMTDAGTSNVRKGGLSRPVHNPRAKPQQGRLANKPRPTREGR